MLNVACRSQLGPVSTERPRDNNRNALDSLRGTSSRAVSTSESTPDAAPLKPRTNSSSVVQESSTPSCGAKVSNSCQSRLETEKKQRAGLTAMMKRPSSNCNSKSSRRQLWQAQRRSRRPHPVDQDKGDQTPPVLLRTAAGLPAGGERVRQEAGCPLAALAALLEEATRKLTRPAFGEVMVRRRTKHTSFARQRTQTVSASMRAKVYVSCR